MNIKEHIDAGHYERDEKGRALVPFRGCKGDQGPITIYATDHGSSFPICGRHPSCADAETYTAEGTNMGGNGDLLPPPPRKVKVTGWAIIDRCGCLRRICTTQHSSDVIGAPSLGDRVVELSGEYEEPWS